MPRASGVAIGPRPLTNYLCVKKKEAMQKFFLALYVLVYLYVWKIFLDMSVFTFLKPYVMVWIISAFICLALSKRKKQLPFLSFFLGSICGPLGILMILLAAKDFRTYEGEEKDKNFYEKIYGDLENVFNLLTLSPRDHNARAKVRDKLIYYNDYFKIGRNFEFIAVMRGRGSRQNLDPRLLLIELRKCLEELDKEYALHFGASLDKVRNKIQGIDEVINNLNVDDYNDQASSHVP
jgi:hypothetical protein